MNVICHTGLQELPTNDAPWGVHGDDCVRSQYERPHDEWAQSLVSSLPVEERDRTLAHEREKQTLDWLGADLAVLSKQVEAGDPRNVPRCDAPDALAL